MATSVSGINGADYSSLINNTKLTNVEKKVNGFDVDSAEDAEMLDACKEFEKYMIEQVYKAMDKTIMRAEEKSDYEEMFGDLRIQKYAESISDKGDFGLAKQLYEHMKSNQGIKPDQIK